MNFFYVFILTGPILRYFGELHVEEIDGVVWNPNFSRQITSEHIGDPGSTPQSFLNIFLRLQQFFTTKLLRLTLKEANLSAQLP